MVIPKDVGERRAFWMGEVEAFRRSGLTQKVWCEERGYKALTFRNWLYERAAKHVKKGDATGAGARFVAVPMVAGGAVGDEGGEVVLSLKGVQVMLRGAAASALVDRLATRLLEGC